MALLMTGSQRLATTDVRRHTDDLLQKAAAQLISCAPSVKLLRKNRQILATVSRSAMSTALEQAA
ncbi:MAG: hypothetical protein J2P17_03450 [Mycobacterium sp.]|nr:hypothetical protein [Mycobacterium sp.]